MGKYLAVAANSIKKNLAYRMNNFITMVSVFISFIVLFYFWNSIYRQGNQIGTYSLEEMISYYVFVTIFHLLVIGDNTAWSVGDEINNGQITSSVLRPINYLKYKFSQHMGNLAYRLMIFLPIILVVLFVLRNYITHAQNYTTYAIFALCAMLSYGLYFLVYFIVGIVAFWTAEAKGFFYTCWVVINFMQGGLIPLDLLPKWFSLISDSLPFKYLFFVPVSLASGRVNFDYKMIVVPVLWCIGMYFLAQLLYKKGLKKYEGYGL
ncbi:MAG TPA: hypothetical protein DEA43_01050 [Candidatus Moranbacteria bacterium]|nr:hypothetical protein [Candidatus Moranbacteria bacterium]HBT45457.1 hypothetical protein [Candidatus Moranbacteria bacterium]